MTMRELTPRERREGERRLCPIDRKYFRPRFRGQKTCGGACARRLVGRKLRARGNPPAFAVMQERRRQAFRDRIVQATRTQFGALTDRERQLFTFGFRTGYDRGYGKGYNHRHRRRRRRPQERVAA